MAHGRSTVDRAFPTAVFTGLVPVKTLLLNKLTLIWALLCIGTLVSQFIGGTTEESAASAQTWRVMILVIAFIKAHLVLHYFMGLDQAPSKWRFIFGSWVVGVAGLLIVLL